MKMVNIYKQVEEKKEKKKKFVEPNFECSTANYLGYDMIWYELYFFFVRARMYFLAAV